MLRYCHAIGARSQRYQNATCGGGELADHAQSLRPNRQQVPKGMARAAPSHCQLTVLPLWKISQRRLCDDFEFYFFFSTVKLPHPGEEACFQKRAHFLMDAQLNPHLSLPYHRNTFRPVPEGHPSCIRHTKARVT